MSGKYCRGIRREFPSQKNRGDPEAAPTNAGRKDRGRGLRAHDLCCCVANATRKPLRRTVSRLSRTRAAPRQADADVEDMKAVIATVVDRFEVVEKDFVAVSKV